MEKERLDLDKIYKFVYVCKHCKKEYGSDSKIVNNLCPVCDPVRKWIKIGRKYGNNNNHLQGDISCRI